MALYYRLDACNPALGQCYTSVTPGQSNQRYIEAISGEYYVWDNTSTTSPGTICTGSIQALPGQVGCPGTPTPTPSPTPSPSPSPTPTPGPAPTPTPTPAPTPTPTPDYCWSGTNATTFTLDGVNLVYTFGGNYGVYGTGTGIYTLTGIPSTEAIAFHNFGKTSLITYEGEYSAGTKTGLDGNVYEYFYGDVTVTITGDYGVISYESYNSGYLGGENNLVFDTGVCVSLQPPIIPPQGDPDTQYTLSYSQGVQGWPSFYSYFPDWMIGMNNYFYSFKGGNLYRHNTNEVRNNYYGVQYNSTITSVFNEQPLENKLFKTIALQSDSAWELTLDSDIQAGASIDDTWFEKKEGVWFAYIRNNGTVPAGVSEYDMRSVSGIGQSTSVNIAGLATTINFDAGISIGSEISVGDMVYFAPPPYTSIELAGQVSSININLQSGINNIVIFNGVTGAVTIPIQNAYIMYIKNQQAESNGLLGHYCLFTATNDDTTPTELLAIQSEVMKSYP